MTPLWHAEAPGGTRGAFWEGGHVAHKGRENADDVLATALACGATADQAAAKAGVSLRTVRRRIADAAFAAKVKDIRRDTVERTAAVLTAASSEAVRTLLGLQKDAVPPAVRLGAAKAILEIGIKAREMVELEVQLHELEQQVKALERERNSGGSPGYPGSRVREDVL